MYYQATLPPESLATILAMKRPEIILNSLLSSDISPVGSEPVTPKRAPVQKTPYRTRDTESFVRRGSTDETSTQVYF